MTVTLFIECMISLHNLFRKTATARQSDLVKLIAGFDPPERD